MSYYTDVLIFGENLKEMIKKIIPKLRRIIRMVGDDELFNSMVNRQNCVCPVSSQNLFDIT